MALACASWSRGTLLSHLNTTVICLTLMWMTMTIKLICHNWTYYMDFDVFISNTYCCFLVFCNWAIARVFFLNGNWGKRKVISQLRYLVMKTIILSVKSETFSCQFNCREISWSSLSLYNIYIEYRSPFLFHSNFVISPWWKFEPYQLVWYQILVFHFPTNAAPQFLWKLAIHSNQVLYLFLHRTCMDKKIHSQSDPRSRGLKHL